MKFSGLFAGLTTIDIQYFVDRFPDANKKVKTEAPGMLTGGPATNAAVAFSLLNGGAYLASATGKNAFSDFINNDFQENNIRHFNLTAASGSNPVLATVITSGVKGERNIFTHNPGPIVPEITATELLKQVKPQILLLDGFYPEALVELAHVSKEHNVTVVLDCGSWKPQYKQLIPLADVVICSADFLPPGCLSVHDVIDYLHDSGNKKSAISRGEKNLLYFEEEMKGEVPVEKVKIKDSLGAGDFLHGAFCFYYLELNSDFENALIEAVKFATFTCRYKETRSWIKNMGKYTQISK
jgi:sugar/nucleoside kinase (ribokinase family)